MEKCLICSGYLDNSLTNEELYNRCIVVEESNVCDNRFSLLFVIDMSSFVPIRFEFRLWNKKAKIWQTVELFVPRYCPFCGREITENKTFFECVKEDNSCNKFWGFNFS